MEELEGEDLGEEVGGGEGCEGVRGWGGAAGHDGGGGGGGGCCCFGGGW